MMLQFARADVDALKAKRFPIALAVFRNRTGRCTDATSRSTTPGPRFVSASLVRLDVLCNRLHGS